MRLVVAAVVAGLVSFIASVAVWRALPLTVQQALVTAEPTPAPTPLAIYTIESLSSATIPKGKIELVELVEENDSFVSQIFSHTFDPKLGTGEKKTVTGQINVPAGLDNRSAPLIVMLRGYVDQSIYQTGVGTKNAAAYFAEKGFITVAPDFLGYAGSDSESGDIFETRFQTYTTVLSLLSSLESIPEYDNKNLFMWAHSNGGQIALSVLAATNEVIPTTLWAPVTRFFPYSVLYYTDYSADRGKFIRSELAKFEQIYDPDKFSFTNYLDKIASPITLHQGTADTAVPVEWSDEFTTKAKSAGIQVEYFKYQGADHNLRPAWNDVVARDFEFFTSHLK